MPTVKCRKCGDIYDTEDQDRCPGCGRVPRLRPGAVAARASGKTTVSESDTVQEMIAPSWWDDEHTERVSKAYANVLKMPSRKLSERQVLVELQYRLMDIAKKSLQKCPKCGSKMKPVGREFACSKCNLKYDRRDYLTDAYLNAAMAIRPLLQKGILFEDAVAGILNHVAVYLGIAPEFKELPDDWNCPICGMPKDKFRVLGNKRFGLF